MNDDQFAKLFKYMQDTRAEMAERFDKVDERINGVYDLLDKNISEHQRQEEERAGMNHQLNRHETWIGQLAEQSGTTLRYE